MVELQFHFSVAPFFGMYKYVITNKKNRTTKRKDHILQYLKKVILIYTAYAYYL